MREVSVGTTAVACLALAAIVVWTASTQAQPDAHQQARIDPGHHMSHLQAARKVKGEDLRTLLERLLGHHAILAVRVMRGQVRGSPELVQTLEDALGANTHELTVAVRSLHGAKGARIFEQLWTNHVVSLFEYAGAVEGHKKKAKKRLLRELDRYRADFGTFVETASDGTLKAEDVAQSLKAHINQLLEQVRAYAAKDYAAAYRLEREAFGHMFPTGKALAGGLAVHHPGESSVALENPAHSLKSALSLLLGEHVELLVEATRSGVRGSREFKYAAKALDRNTEDLTESVRALFGRKNARRFNDIWADHIDYLMDYTIGKAGGNEKAQRKAMRRMRTFVHRFPRYLTRVTGLRASPRVSRQIARHEHLIVDQLNAYDARKFDLAIRVSNRAYNDMFSTAVELGGLLQKRFPSVAPVGGAGTGGGGTR
ncbi:MAG TPA: hypothetical protein VFS38_04720 [Actinomycetota bacterium]|nr:hypothetical protein [Actinomycetota bacterium]